MIKRRNTLSKEVVLAVLTNSKKAMSQDAIISKLEVDIDRATIYRILNRFCEDGILHRIVADDGKQYFALCIKCDKQSIPDNHFHFRCVECETIECMPLEVQFSVPRKYKVQRMNCVLIGVCKDCR